MPDSTRDAAASVARAEIKNRRLPRNVRKLDRDTTRAWAQWVADLANVLRIEGNIGKWTRLRAELLVHAAVLDAISARMQDAVTLADADEPIQSTAWVVAPSPAPEEPST